MVAAYADAPKGDECCYCGEVGRACRNETKNGCHSDGVKLNARRRPKTSQPIPQKIAPTSRPMFWDRVRYGGLDGEKSLANRCDWASILGRYLMQPDGIQSITYMSEWLRATCCRSPSEAYDDEKLPLIPSHADFLDLVHASVYLQLPLGFGRKRTALLSTRAFASYTGSMVPLEWQKHPHHQCLCFGRCRREHRT